MCITENLKLYVMEGIVIQTYTKLKNLYILPENLSEWTCMDPGTLVNLLKRSSLMAH